MGSKMKTIIKILNYSIITAVVIFAFLIVGVKIFGVKIYTVISGSMEPNYKVGSLIYVVDTDTELLKVGDVITFNITENVIATHRIVAINNENNDKKFQTKGDANDDVDENFVESKNIIGKPIFTIPYLGFVTSFMQTTAGKMITLGCSVLLVIIVIFLDSITDDKKKNV